MREALAEITQPSVKRHRQFKSLSSSQTTTQQNHTSSSSASTAFAPPTAPVEYPCFFETQEELRCGRHALNNALGGELIFTNADLSTACDVLIAESCFPDANGVLDIQRREDHESAAGWYSEEVLATALRASLHYELLLQPLKQNVNKLMEENIVGAICNKNNQHWIAFKYVDGAVWLLDSVSRPQRLSHESYVRFVNDFPYTYPIRRFSRPPRAVASGDAADCG